MPFPADGTKVKLGKGSLLLDQLSSDGSANGFDFAGNVSALTLSADVTNAELFSSTQRSAPRIARAVTRIAYTLTATLNEYTYAMLKKFLLATEATKAQTLQASDTAQIVDVVLGRYYQIGARQITNVTVAVGSNTMTLNTDYTLNTEFGIVRPLAGGAIQDDDDLDITFDRPALTIQQLRLAQEASPICHLLYLADDANQDGAGARDRLEIWRANAAPEGELGVIGDEYGSYQLSFAVLSDSENHPSDPFGTLDRIAA